MSDFCIGAASTRLPAVDAARAQFAAAHALALPHALEPSFLATLLRLCDTGHFESNPTDPGHREVESPQRASRALNLALSRPETLNWLAEVTQSGPLSQIEGRVAQTLPRPGDELVWHDDLAEAGSNGSVRKLALVINLGSAPYQGGDFELRYKRLGEQMPGPEILHFQHDHLGSALVFRVSRKLEHRVLPLTAGGPRRVFAGWAFSGK